jgi:5-methylcytosine-specific restriction endonuclease McrA
MKIDRNKVHEKYAGRCAYCGVPISIKEMHVDHIHPQFLADDLNGKNVDNYENLNPACRVCNLWKKTFSVDEFRHEIEMQTERLRRHSASFRLAEKYNLIATAHREIRFYFERRWVRP